MRAREAGEVVDDDGLERAARRGRPETFECGTSPKSPGLGFVGIDVARIHGQPVLRSEGEGATLYDLDDERLWMIFRRYRPETEGGEATLDGRFTGP